MNQKDLKALCNLGSKYTPPKDPKILSKRTIKSRLRKLEFEINERFQYKEKLEALKETDNPDYVDVRSVLGYYLGQRDVYVLLLKELYEEDEY